jgi:hypothetical protein
MGEPIRAPCTSGGLYIQGTEVLTKMRQEQRMQQDRTGAVKNGEQDRRTGDEEVTIM